MAVPSHRLTRDPLVRLAAFLLFELLLILQISESTWVYSGWAKAYVEAIGAIAPAVHHLDRIATNPAAVSFIMAISPVLLLPRIVFWVQWLYSDRLRNLRYFVVSPLTRRVPKDSMDFVTDPLRGAAENEAPSRLQTISTFRAVCVSIALLILAIVIGLAWPWLAYGYDVVRNRTPDFREAATAAGGWRLWLSWSVYQMNLSAFFLAMGFCTLQGYYRWFAGLLHKEM